MLIFQASTPLKTGDFSLLSWFRGNFFIAVLLLVLVSCQYLLWFGEGGWRQVWANEQNLAKLSVDLEKDRIYLERIKIETTDLNEGYKFVEERARFELGMKKSGEQFLMFR